MKKNSKKEYSNYLSSDHWKEMVKKYRGFNCIVCGSCSSLCLHHITYENKGRETDKDFATLCETCHQTCHFDVHFGNFKKVSNPTDESVIYINSLKEIKENLDARRLFLQTRNLVLEQQSLFGKKPTRSIWLDNKSPTKQISRELKKQKRGWKRQKRLERQIAKEWTIKNGSQRKITKEYTLTNEQKKYYDRMDKLDAEFKKKAIKLLDRKGNLTYYKKTEITTFSTQLIKPYFEHTVTKNHKKK